jgi:1-deoxy-D-xylulose-5-phosphate reductoisomerase
LHLKSSEIKNLAILGCTGSVGRQTLSVVDAHPELFRVKALTAYGNEKALDALTAKYAPEFSALTARDGDEANITAATLDSVDTVVIAITGMKAIFPLRAALKAKKRVALANKESIVCGGELLKAELDENRDRLLPVDSEHSALFQCMQGLSNRGEVSRIILTASGGPFRDYTAEQLKNVTVEMALRHPSWNMGRKITIDCATLANKGLEVIEAHVLFGIGADQIDVLIHPGSIVHSFVETIDGALLAQLGAPDMRLPIQYALTWPKRLDSPVKRLSAADLATLRFELPDTQRFPALRMAYDALKAGGTATAVYNAANEMAVSAFLEGKAGFLEIPAAIESALCAIPTRIPDSFEEILDADRRAREHVLKRIAR